MKKTILYLLIFSFFNYTGCYSSKVVGKNIFYSENNSRNGGDIMIITYEGQTIQIIEDKYKVINDTLYAEGINKTNTSVYNQTVDVKTALSDIKYVKIEELDGLKTTGCVIGSAGAILLLVLIAAAASQPRSCEGPKSWSN